MKHISFGNLDWQFREIENEISEEVWSVLRSGNYVSGAKVERFEKGFANFAGSQRAVALNSGTSALHAALLAIGVGRGHEVIVPSHTFIASATAVVLAGATPVLVNVDEHGLICGQSVDQSLSSKTKAIIPVHLYGSLVARDLIKKFKTLDLMIIEDASQAHGARYSDGTSIGQDSELATYSFYPGKNLGAAGEGGAVTSNNEDFGEKVSLIRNWGSPKRYSHEILGFNYRMDEIQAVVLNAKLRLMRDWNEQRQRIAKRYNNYLTGLPVRIVNNLEGSPVFHQFVIEVEDRDRLREYLESHGISTQIHYPIPIHKQPALKDYVVLRENLSFTESLTSRILSLPIYPGLLDEEVEYVCEKIADYFVIH